MEMSNKKYDNYEYDDDNYEVRKPKKSKRYRCAKCDKVCYNGLRPNGFYIGYRINKDTSGYVKMNLCDKCAEKLIKPFIETVKETENKKPQTFIVKTRKGGGKNGKDNKVHN